MANGWGLRSYLDYVSERRERPKLSDVIWTIVIGAAVFAVVEGVMVYWLFR